MKHPLPLTVAALMALATTSVHADPTAFVGLSYNFEDKIGITAKVLSNDKKDKVVAALGATFYLDSQNSFGMDASAGYTFDDAAVLLGYDFLLESPVISAGWADIDCPGSGIC